MSVNMYESFVIVAAFLLLLGPSCTNSDNLALLLGTMKNVQRAICDDELVTLACPKGTAISIQVAQYGKAAPEEQGCVADTSGDGDNEKKCKRPNSMQYLLLQTVVEKCQRKPQCTFSTKLKPGVTDPCPSERKYVEVLYKCRPLDFRSRTACENDVITLRCSPKSRIAIFDAKFGRTPLVMDEAIVCPQTQGMPEETCSVPHAADKVMQLCLGKRRCQITANTRTFGSPCQTYSSPYLKVVYACVPLGVLVERYESAAEKDEMDINVQNNSDNLFDDTEGVGEKWRETSLGLPVADPALQLPEGDVTVPNKIEETTIYTFKPNLEKTKEISLNSKLFIYIGVAVIIFACLIIILVVVRCYHDRRIKKNSNNGDMFTTEAPNVFNDAVSDIDNDVDVSHISGTFYDPLHPDMILYRDGPGTSTLRAMRPLSTVYPCTGANMYGKIDYVPPHGRDTTNRFTRSRSKEERLDPDLMTSPKSLSVFSNQQFYYG